MRSTCCRRNVTRTGPSRSIRAVDFPRRWELAATLLSNVQAADSTIFEDGGKWWLFTAGIGGKDLGRSELSLFFSDSLFGPWMPHPKDPIVCDVSGARPAGALFYEQGELIRPAQDCSRRYGYAISLHRVEVLSETDYRGNSRGPDSAGVGRGPFRQPHLKYGLTLRSARWVRQAPTPLRRRQAANQVEAAS